MSKKQFGWATMAVGAWLFAAVAAQAGGGCCPGHATKADKAAGATACATDDCKADCAAKDATAAPAEAKGATSAPEATAVKAQTLCPVMNRPINPKLYVDVEGKRIYVCCPGCIAAVKADPAKYIQALEAQGVTLEAAPAAQ